MIPSSAASVPGSTRSRGSQSCSLQPGDSQLFTGTLVIPC